MEESREFNMKFTLTNEEWENLERYASNENLQVQEYLHKYFSDSISRALREGYITDYFLHDDTGKRISELSLEAINAEIHEARKNMAHK